MGDFGMEEKVLNILKKIKSDIDIKDYDMDLFANDVLNSLAIVSILVMIEETFSIEIDPEDIVPENFQSMRTICRLIETYARQ